MKSIKGAVSSSLLLALVAGPLPFAYASASPGGVTVDFESLALPTAGFLNGSDGSAGFSESGVFFNNSFNSAWQTWSGWAISNQADLFTPGFGNQYSVFAPGNGSSQFAVAYNFSRGVSTIALPDGLNSPLAFDVALTTYTFWDLVQGSPFSSGLVNDGDFFKLTIFGVDKAGNTLGSIPVVLAERSNGLLSFLPGWTAVDLSSLGNNISFLEFELASSDVGLFGMNTPAYFAIDNLVIAEGTPIPEPATVGFLFGLGCLAFVIAQRRWKIAGKRAA